MIKVVIVTKNYFYLAIIGSTLYFPKATQTFNKAMRTCFSEIKAE